MINEPFYINNRFFVDPRTHLLRDEAKTRETRLEPRLLQVLCLLAEKKGLAVTREELVSIIWKDYGGGDDGLTQAISTLRKVLDDAGKNLIQTIPKKGYCFQGTVSYAQDGKNENETHYVDQKSKGKKKFILAAAASLICLSIPLYFVLRKIDNVDRQASPPPQVGFPGLHPIPDSLLENETNTIITKGPDSTTYKLVMIGDEPPKFFVNAKQLPVDQWEPYQPLINHLKSQIKKRNK